MGKFNRGPSIDASYQIASFGSFAQAIFLKIDQSETRIACGGHVCKWIGAKWVILIKDLPYMLPTKFRLISLGNFKEEDLPVAAMLVNGSGWNKQSL